jgi:hypothetical protein
MQVGWSLFCMCVVVSLATPPPSREQLDAMGWQPRLRALTQAKVRGLSHPRVVSIGLFAVMLILYVLLR